MSDHKRIIWIASYPKSGNTWIRIFFENLVSGSDQPVDINQLSVAKIASSRMLFDNYAGVNSSDLTRNEIELYRPEVYRIIAHEAENDVLLKVHDAWKLNSSGEELFPADITKGVIYLIRNPLDVVVSNAFHHTIDFRESVSRFNTGQALCNQEGRLYNQFKQDLFNWSDHVLSWVDRSGLPLLVVRYEDLIENPIYCFKSILYFIDWKHSKIDVMRAVKNSEINLLKEQEAKMGFREKPLNAGSFFRVGKSGSWKEFLPRELVKSIYQNHKAIIERFDYSANIANHL